VVCAAILFPFFHSQRGSNTPPLGLNLPYKMIRARVLQEKRTTNENVNSMQMFVMFVFVVVAKNKAVSKPEF
jgi:hypothetical protein